MAEHNGSSGLGFSRQAGDGVLFNDYAGQKVTIHCRMKVVILLHVREWDYLHAGERRNLRVASTK